MRPCDPRPCIGDGRVVCQHGATVLHPAVRCAACQAKRARRAERQREYQRRYRAAHPDRERAYNAARYATDAYRAYERERYRLKRKVA